MMQKLRENFFILKKKVLSIDIKLNYEPKFRENVNKFYMMLQKLLNQF